MYIVLDSVTFSTSTKMGCLDVRSEDICFLFILMLVDTLALHKKSLTKSTRNYSIEQLT